MTEKYWKTGNDIYFGVPIGNAVEITEQEFEQIMQERRIEIIRLKRDQLITSVLWRKERHQDEVLLSMNPTEPLQPILEYIQALRDVTKQQGFPKDIIWPEVP